MSNFCANNYLGVSSAPRVLDAAHRVIDEHGFGLSSIRFVCGTQDAHTPPEATIGEFDPDGTVVSRRSRVRQAKDVERTFHVEPVGQIRSALATCYCEHLGR